MKKVIIKTVSVGQCFGTLGIVKDADTGARLYETATYGYDCHTAARADAESHAEKQKWTIVEAPVELTVSCRAFTGEGARLHKVRVHADGSIKVFDAVAGYYTSAHVLAPSAEQRIRRLAKVAS